MVDVRQLINIRNDDIRFWWVRQVLLNLNPEPGSTVVDVGSGEQPFRQFLLDLGLHYIGHDFGKYVPSGASMGLQNNAWNYGTVDIEGDILDLPQLNADFILCTEVLEHVPDPVASLRAMVNALAPGGVLIITVPFLSLMHQAPYWYSSGLSPFWFQTWADSLGLQVQEVTVAGDYLDLTIQESRRIFGSFLGGRLAHFRDGVQRIASTLRAKSASQDDYLTPRDVYQSRLSPWMRNSAPRRILRKHLPQPLLESGALGTFVVLVKPEFTVN